MSRSRPVLPTASLTDMTFAGNFDRGEAAEFLKGFSDVLGPGDTMLIGLDACNDPARV